MATATNPKSRSKKSTNKKENNDVSDTATEEAVQADTAPEAPAPEAPAEDTGKLSSQSEVAPEDVLFDAIVSFASDQNVQALQDVYRSVHTSSRGKAQGVAMKRAMTEGGVDMDTLGQVLDAFNNLPAAAKSSRTKPQLDEGTLHSIQLTGMMVGFRQLQEEFGEDAFNLASGWYENGAPEEHQAAITRVAENTVKASVKGLRTRSGGRSSMSEKISDLLGRGALTAGQVLKGANDVTATVNEDGTLTTTPEGGEAQTFDNPSAAARIHRIKEDGKPTSTNGWDFWTTEDGTKVGDLRQS